MSLEFPCVHYEKGKCKLNSDPEYTDWCHLGPCPDETASNADLIRRMTDEELADRLLTIDGPGVFCTNRPECAELIDTEAGIPVEMCKECMLNWLRKPAGKEIADGNSC